MGIGEALYTFFFCLRQASQPRLEGTPGILGVYSIQVQCARLGGSLFKVMTVEPPLN